MNRGEHAIAGLYVITDAHWMPEPVFLEKAEAALRGGARILQYRDKGDPRKEAVRRRYQASALRELCAQYGALFVVNDDPELARAVQASALHVGAEDAPVAALREVFGPQLCIGVSCYASLDKARQAIRDGADYVAFGAFFASPSKPQAARVDLQVLQKARAELNMPLVAIGGITEDNGGQLIAAGADALAVISGVFAPEQIGEVEQAARRFAALFDDSGRISKE
ncbi:thiamine phosphate synthase [Acidithiobacillus sp. M4-SHS-6]|uniref:thiamine phosphate synthase n=1 Tax=Acidithiobacillus sp. M4-SHS-6 TaxID=3383024 RepID=UPI0039BDE328